MKQTLLLLATALLLAIQSYAQTGVAINTTGNDPDTSAMLDVSSTEKGMLIPRMTEAQRTTIASPAKGLLVYQNDGTEGFYYFDGANWTRLASGIYTETDPVFGNSAAHGITSTNISNWNTAHGWGNHAGLYRPIGYVPSWSEITSNPFSFSLVANNQLLKYNTTTSKWENWAPDFLTSFTETDPVYSANVDVTGAANGDLLKFDGTKFVKFSPNYALTSHTHLDATTSVSGFLGVADKTKLDKYPVGTAAGQMQYWNGSAWITVAVGQNGQILKYKNGAPTWVDDYIENLSIGDYYQGGIIVYFLQPGDLGYDANVRHGIIAALSDQSTGTQWGCYETSITGAGGTVIGTGYQNTLDIVAGCSTAGIAAQICNDLDLNGYSDWYLPSEAELNKLYLIKTAIGGFTDSYYWSSSERNNITAYAQNFSNGAQWYRDKNYFNLRVRAVRSF